MAYDILSLESARCVEDETRAPLKRCLNGGPDRPEKGSLMIWKDCGQGVAEAASMSLNPVQPPKDSLAALEFEGPKWVDRAKKGHPAEFQGKNRLFFFCIHCQLLDCLQLRFSQNWFDPGWGQQHRGINSRFPPQPVQIV